MTRTAMSDLRSTPPVEIVTWIDHFASESTEWLRVAQVAEQSKEDCVIRTVGMVVGEDDDKIVLTFSARLDTDWAEPHFAIYKAIYKKLILDRTPLMAVMPVMPATGTMGAP